MVVSFRNVLREEEYSRGLVLCAVPGSRYPGGFIGDPVMKRSWIDEKVEGWTDLVEMLAEVVL